MATSDSAIPPADERRRAALEAALAEARARSGAQGAAPDSSAVRARLRSVLVFTAGIKLVPFGSLQRSEYKSKLVQH